MTLKKQRTYVHDTSVRKYQSGQKKMTCVDKDGNVFDKEVYYRPEQKYPVGNNYAADPKLVAYREKVFSKTEPQYPEYYEGFDNCVKSAVDI